jgi:hypothetical protein
MGDVVTITRKDDSHLLGMAKCLACSHEWMSVAPVGVYLLQCPKCECDKGVMKGTVHRRDEMWHCRCGNCFFLVSRDGCFCPNCGEWARF